MFMLDQDLNEQISELISTALSYVDNVFFKCVHFVENSGILFIMNQIRDQLFNSKNIIQEIFQIILILFHK